MIERLLSLALAATLALTACQPTDDTSDASAGDTLRVITPEQNRAAHLKAKPSFRIDTLATATANFIAGIDTGPQLTTLTRSAAFAEHKKTVEQEWAKVREANLLPIRMWARENHITSPNDTLTMIYPFSGPDFLYANTFFPYCKNYILMGLEEPGAMPKLEGIAEPLLNTYLENLRHSLRYINKKGYFITSQMQKDLNQQNLDGTLHLMLYYLARTGHQIVQVQQVRIDEFGRTHPIDDPAQHTGRITGLRIEFAHPERDYTQQLFYFRMNLADENVKQKSEFLYFLNAYGPKVFYTKSASYILHDAQFSTIRKLLLDQSQKILQDDTGIPYFLLDNGNYRISLYGDYTRTISDFEHNYQPRLKEALDARQGDFLLPFKIGYNAWFNETVLIYGESISAEEKQKLVAQRNKWRQEQPKQKPDAAAVADQQLAAEKGLVFRIQLLSKEKPIDTRDAVFRGLKDVGYYKLGKNYFYTIGQAKTVEALQPYRDMAKKAGFGDAFAVAFSNGERISISEAIELQKKR